MNSIYCDYIKNKNIIKFIYEGHLRIVEIYRHGTTLKDNEVISCYQIRGTSNSGILGWKPFLNERIQGEITIESSYTNIRKGYNKKTDRYMNIIHCDIS